MVLVMNCRRFMNRWVNGHCEEALFSSRPTRCGGLFAAGVLVATATTASAEESSESWLARGPAHPICVGVVPVSPPAVRILRLERCSWNTSSNRRAWTRRTSTSFMPMQGRLARAAIRFAHRKNCCCATCDEAGRTPSFRLNRHSLISPSPAVYSPVDGLDCEGTHEGSDRKPICQACRPGLFRSDPLILLRLYLPCSIFAPARHGSTTD